MPIDEEARLFESARKIDDADARRAFLDRECPDSALLHRLEQLLSADSLSNFPSSAIGPLPLFYGQLEGPGTELGPYRLIRVVGEGGMGVVFLAEQSSPIRRTVALKIIRPGMDTREVVARFEAERQALALMEHANVAKVLDAGVAPSGRPYFVMEYIEGVAITRFATERKLELRERLTLFLAVCDAIQHAHRKGVIHRDIKPSNVLVTVIDDRPTPKVIDFGVAKAIAASLTEKTLATAIGHFCGTLEYMSPEQVQLDTSAVDTRTDVYGLGVLLYELLTGATPFSAGRLRTARFEAIQRIICHEDAPRPSRRLADEGTDHPTVISGASAAMPSANSPARQAISGISALQRAMRRDLDWVVMKAIEKDRDRRYDSAGEFGDDIRRFLNHEPVSATPPSAIYRWTKLFRRHRAICISSAAVLLALVAGTVIATWQAVRANDAAESRRKALLQVKTSAQETEVALTAARAAAEKMKRALDRESEALAETNTTLEGLRRVQRRLLSSNGYGEIENGDYFRGLMWYSAARRIPLSDTAADATLQVRTDLCERECPRLLALHRVAVRRETAFSSGPSARISPDGEVLGCEAGVFSVRTGKALVPVGPSEAPVETVFTPNGPATVIQDGPLSFSVWTGIGKTPVRTPRIRITPSEKPGSPMVALSPDARYLAVCIFAHGRRLGLPSSKVEIFDVASGKLIRSEVVQNCFRFRFSPDSKFLATYATLDFKRLIPVAPGTEMPPFISGEDRITQLDFSPDSMLIAMSLEGRQVQLFDRATGELVQEFPDTEGTHSVIFSPNGDLVSLNQLDGFKVARITDGHFLMAVRHEPYEYLPAAFTRNGDFLAVNGREEGFRFWRTQDGLRMRQVIPRSRGESISEVATSGQRMLTYNFDSDGFVKLWDIEPVIRSADVAYHKHLGKRVKAVDLGSTYVGTPGKEAVWWSRLVGGDRSYLSESELVIARSSIGEAALVKERKSSSLAIRNFGTNTLIASDAMLHDRSEFANFSPEAAMFATVNGANLALWETATGEPIWTWPRCCDWVWRDEPKPFDPALTRILQHCEFAPDGRRLTHIQEDGTEITRIVVTDADFSDLDDRVLTAAHCGIDSAGRSFNADDASILAAWERLGARQRRNESSR